MWDVYLQKSLLNLSENFNKAKKNFSTFGIETGTVTLNLSKMMKIKEKSVTSFNQRDRISV